MVEHVNRNGASYFLHEGRTKTGKPKYFFAKKREGKLASAIPDGFEIYESPNAQVTLRKIQPQLVTPEEVHIVECAARMLASGTNCLVEVKGASIIVHTAADPLKGSERLFERMGIPAGFRSRAPLAIHLNYTAMLRFTLIDEERRLFGVERYCFKGAIDDWIWVGAANKLETQAAVFCKHLDKESFYDLM